MDYRNTTILTGQIDFVEQMVMVIKTLILKIL